MSILIRIAITPYQLRSALGAGLVGFLPDGVAAALTTIDWTVREEISLWAFLTDAQKSAVRAATTPAAAVEVAANLQDALSEVALRTGRLLKIPPGFLRVSAACTYTPNESNGADYTSGLMLRGQGMGKTVLINAVSGAPMIGAAASGTAGNFAKGNHVADLSIIGDGVATNQVGIRSKGSWYSTWERVRVIKLAGTASVIGDDSILTPDFTANASNIYINCEFDQNWLGINNPVNNNAPMIMTIGGSMRNNKRGGLVSNSSHVHIRGTSIAFNGFLDTANATGGVYINELNGAPGYRTKDVIIEGCEMDTNYPSHLNIQTAESVSIRNNGFMWHDYGTASEIIALPTWPAAQIILGGVTSSKRVIKASVVDNRVAFLNENNIAGGMAGHTVLLVNPYAQNVEFKRSVYDLTPGAATLGVNCWIARELSKAGTTPDLSAARYHLDYDLPLANAPGSGVYVTTSNAFGVPFRKVFEGVNTNLQYQVSIASEGVKSFEVPNVRGESATGSNYGWVAVNVAGSAARSDLFNYRAASGPVCTKLGTASTDVNVTTGALTGTTGAASKITVSAHTDGKIYVENRTGNTVIANVSFLTNPGYQGQA